LHALNDHYHGLFERHLVALAAEMRLSMAEVYEVASFYHHFEVLKDDAMAPRLTVRVCESLSCQMAGADAMLAQVPALLGTDVRWCPRPASAVASRRRRRWWGSAAWGMPRLKRLFQCRMRRSAFRTSASSS
jgi:hypothetical protein